MKILLIEDNKEIATNISEYLKLEGHIVAWSGRGDTGLDISLSNEFDIILLDLTLPGTDGIDICRQIRKKKAVPIIMITARESIDDKVLGLDTGANDYLVKPFDLRELVARISALTRSNIGKKILQTETLSLDFESRNFFYKNNKIALTQKEYLILQYIIKNRPNVVSRTDIIESVWGGEDDLFSADAKLDVYISNIRSKLGKDIIETVKGVGYKCSIFS